MPREGEKLILLFNGTICVPAPPERDRGAPGERLGGAGGSDGVRLFQPGFMIFLTHGVGNTELKIASWQEQG